MVYEVAAPSQAASDPLKTNNAEENGFLPWHITFATYVAAAFVLPEFCSLSALVDWKSSALNVGIY